MFVNSTNLSVEGIFSLDLNDKLFIGFCFYLGGLASGIPGIFKLISIYFNFNKHFEF